jgi:hypothetical protein
MDKQHQQEDQDLCFIDGIFLLVRSRQRIFQAMLSLHCLGFGVYCRAVAPADPGLNASKTDLRSQCTVFSARPWVWKYTSPF